MNRPTPRPGARPDTHPWLRLLAAVGMTLALVLPAFVVPALLDDDDEARAGGIELAPALDEAPGLATRDNKRRRRPHSPQRAERDSPETSL